MGLELHLDVEDIGLPTEVTAYSGGYEISIPVDYSEALEAFVEVFEDVATSLVPVDTGYLQSTIFTDTDGEFTADCYADAEYAQYPEYGTWCQEAQPYFRPALQEAWPEFCVIAIEAIAEAQQEAIEEMEASIDEEDDDGVDVDDIQGSIMALIGMIVFFPIALYGYGIAQTLSDAFTNGSQYGDFSASSFDGMGLEMPEIEIT